jgi:uncharacterized membrane protein
VQRTSRGLANILVGVLAILTLGAIALSLSMAPPVAEQQLNIAAKATMMASGFVLTDTNSVTALSPAPAAAPGQILRTEVVHILYGAPDAVEEAEAGAGTGGQSVSVIVIGDRRYRRTGAQWTKLPVSPGLGTQAVNTILSPLKEAAAATVVTRHGGVYTFVPRNIDQFITTVLGANPSQLSSPRLTAVVRGDFLADELITAVLNRQRLGVDLVFSAIGSAPPVVAPPASSPAPPAGSSPTPAS